MGRAWDSTKRMAGIEFRMARWAVRHPGMTLTPALLGAAVAEFGPTVTGGVVGGLTLAGLGWYRGHPGSFDALAAPVLRSWRRRWLGEYRGRRWQDLMDACDLSRIHRRTGEVLYPRVLRVRAFSPSIDTVWVRLVRGQALKHFAAQAEELAASLRAERVAVEPIRPGVVALIVQRDEPFTHIIPAPEMPEDAQDVDLRAVYLGETEYGDDWTEPLIGTHRLTAGATGSGKNSVAFATLRSVAPLIRDGIVKLWICDPKYLEFVALKPLAQGRYANDSEECLELIQRWVEDMRATQQRMQRAGLRTVTPSPEWPVNLLIVDEIGTLLAYDPTHAREIARLLAQGTSMGRATLHVLDAYVQEPSKDVVEIRDLFPLRICLRTTSATHPDMVLGEDARARGAVADQIPAVPETAGIGFRVVERTRSLRRVRAAYTDGDAITELVQFVTGKPGLRVVA